MAVVIRMTRQGAKKNPFYHIVAADSRCPRDGRFIEKLGTYNPMLEKGNDQRVRLNAERIKHWLSVGATPSDRVARFLGEAKLAPMPKWTESPKKSAPKKKAQERAAAAAKAAEEAAAAPAEAAPEAPAA
jgi:small subunit ribosomal protein S16